MTFRERRRSTLAAAGLSAAALALTGCGGVAQDSTAKDGTITVVASTNVWGDVVQQIGGNAVEVQPLISDANADPHSYESTPQDAAKVIEADLVVFNGAGYDAFIEEILEASPSNKPTVEIAAIADEGHHAAPPVPPAEDAHGHGDHAAPPVPPAEDAHGHGDHAAPPVPPAEDAHGHDDGHGHGEGHSVNEHFWYDLHAVDAAADHIAAELGKLQPAKAQEFTANAERFRARVGELEAQVQQIAATRPGTKVITTAPVAHYLIKESGLDDITPGAFVNAVEAENDPPAAAIAEVQNALTTRQASALIYNPQVESPITEQLRTHAERAGIPVVPMTETMPEGQDYLQWMGAQISQLREATSAK